MKTVAQELNVKKFPFTIKDKNNNEIYYENSNGHWWKQEYDSNNNRIYIENSKGEVIDKRNINGLWLCVGGALKHESFNPPLNLI